MPDDDQWQEWQEMDHAELEAEYASHMQDLWIREELRNAKSEEYSERLYSLIIEAYNAHRPDLTLMVDDVNFAKTNRRHNLRAINSLILMERVTRELIVNPFVNASLSEGTALHKNSRLIQFIDSHIKPKDVFLEMIKSETFFGSISPILADLQLKLSAFETDGFIKKDDKTNPSQSPLKIMDRLTEFRNKLMHGRLCASELQADIIESIYEAWVRLIDAVFQCYGLKLDRNMRMTTI